jgi:phospholipid/cholesterol/gamma-HCH transport system substrate-binding protein
LELKVGLLILAGTLAIVYSSILVTGWQPGQADTYRVSARFDSVAGLLTGSPVHVAGIKIGQVAAIELDEGKARVDMDIFQKHTLRADSRAALKSLGILGDKYVELTLGSPGQPELQDGDAIIFVLPGGDLDTLVDTTSEILADVKQVTAALRDTLGGERGRRRLDAILDRVALATGDLSRITAAIDARIEDIMANLQGFSGNLNEITEENRAGLKTTIANLNNFSQDLAHITRRNRETLDAIIANINVFTEALAKDGPQIAGDLREILEENKSALNSSITNLDRSMAKLDKTMANVESISAKLDTGEGSLGKLINDETTVDNLNEALEGLNGFLTDLDRLKLDIGGHTEFLTSQGEYKSYFSIYLQPLKDRFYLLQLVDNPRGDVETKQFLRTETVDTGTPQVTETELTETRDELQFTILVNQRYFDTVVRGGLIESSFGLGVEQYFGSRDQFRLGLDVWDLNNEFGPHVKVTAYWQFFSNAFLVAGGDDLVSDNGDLRDTFIGFGLRFNEDSLKPLLSSLPISSAN